MRLSQAALALIVHQSSNGQPIYLVQWNDRWQRYSLVGGHIEAGETAWECCVREVEEELELSSQEFHISPEPVCPTIEYVAYSVSSGVDTQYRVELFKLSVLQKSAWPQIEANPLNRWVSREEVLKLMTVDRQPIAEQVRIVFQRSGVLPMPKVFISATSRDLKSYRQVAAEWARSRRYDVVVQDEFPVMSDYGTIVQMLRDKLAPCDAVIHLAGLFYGFEPTNRPDGEARRSYTQLEYELGQEHKRQVFRFIARPDYAPDTPIVQSEELAELQLQHRQRLMTGDQLYYEFSTKDELRQLLEKIEIQEVLAKPQNLPLVGSLFKGRDDFLEQLRSVLVTKPTHIAAVTAKQAIHGLGGVGKTRVAVEYAKRYSHEYTALLFITADSESSLKSNLAQLCGAMVLNLPEQSAREQEVQVAAAIRWLREHAGWFLIVDNVDTPEAATAAEELLQKLDSGHVVITSRLSQWGHAVLELALDVLSETAAKEMLLERTAGKRKPSPSDAIEALALAKDLGCLPLALEQAGAFIVEDGCSFAEYRQLWKKKDDEVLTWHTHLMKYPRSVATTWQTSFEKVGLEGQALLNILCWLAPEPIPLTMLEKLDAVEGEATINWKKARRDLARYSLVKWSDSTNRAIVVHRLVQEITEYRLPEAEKLGWLKRSLQMVNSFTVGNPQDVRTWNDVYTPARPHILSITHTADQQGVAEPTARLMNQLALYLMTRASHSEAEPLYRRSLRIDEANYGLDDFCVAAIVTNLALLLQQTNRFSEAELFFRRALTINEQTFGSDHPNVARDLNNLALLLQETNRFSEAEPLYRQALAINEQTFDSDHLNLAIGLNNLALLLQATNRFSEAEPLYRRALAINEQTFGSDHPNVARDLNNLAALLQETNRFSEAEPLYRQALAINEQSFGSDHPNVAIGLNNLAALLQATNRLSEVEQLSRRALAINEQTFGSDHPNVARDLNNLAALLQATNRFSEAEPLYRRALTIDEQSFGNEHPNVARDLNNLAALLQETNRCSEAEPLMRRALAIDEQSFGPDHPDVAIGLNNLAGLLKATNRLSEAEQLIKRVVSIFELSYGKNHSNVATALNNLAQLIKATERSFEAEPLMRRALAIDEQSFGTDHPKVAIGLNNLALLLQATNRLAEAEPLSRRALVIVELFLLRTGHSHPHHQLFKNNYNCLLQELGRSEAEIQAALDDIAAEARAQIKSE